eukprot:3063589-Alexandrium_andersonii.AAC.1
MSGTKVLSAPGFTSPCSHARTVVRSHNSPRAFLIPTSVTPGAAVKPGGNPSSCSGCWVLGGRKR